MERSIRGREGTDRIRPPPAGADDVRLPHTAFGSGPRRHRGHAGQMHGRRDPPDCRRLPHGLLRQGAYRPRARMGRVRRPQDPLDAVRPRLRGPRRDIRDALGRHSAHRGPRGIGHRDAGGVLPPAQAGRGRRRPLRQQEADVRGRLPRRYG